MDVLRMERRYIVKYTGKYVSDIVAAHKSEMVARYTAATELFWAVENQVRGLLAGEAVLVFGYPAYHCFAREVLKKQLRFGGGFGLVAEVALLVTKWARRGCDPVILAKIQDELFAIPAPGGAP